MDIPAVPRAPTAERQDADVVVVGVGPGGLQAAACLQLHSRNVVPLEQDRLAASWYHFYDVAELQQRLVLQPDNITVVPYYRGPFCITADGAVPTLKAAGRQALRLVGGCPKWAAARLPVQRDSA